MSQSAKITEGEVEFHVPEAGKPCKTWYKVVGDLDDPKHKRPVVVLHGGPGSSYLYMQPIAKLWDAYSIPVVLYDQIGNGNSTHLREKNGDESFWTEELFMEELKNLLKHLKIDDDYDMLGHSWGGILGARLATFQPEGLKRLVICNSPASADLWVTSANKFKASLPDDIRVALMKHEEAGTIDNKEYEEATQAYYRRHVCRLETWPKELVDTFEAISQDNTVYMTMNGPNEFFITGSLRTWTIVDELHKISVPTLLVSGKYDSAQDEVVSPFFYNIPKCKWVRFEASSHLPHFEEAERFLELVGNFLTQVQPSL